MAEDIIRVLRIYEFVGPRAQVENQVARSIHGTKYVRDYNKSSEIVIRATTIPGYPEILVSPTCAECGLEMQRDGEVYKCANCGGTSGCS